ITVATNMAGRGTDIVLGGNAERMLEAEMRQKGWEPESPEAKALAAELRERCAREQEEIKGLGGLLVIGTERHEARRIDNQLRGRCGRQGDPGESQFFVSMEDDLMRLFGSDKIKNMMEALKVPEDMPLQASMMSKRIESAQK